ncbi:hypothetical protein ARMGADRAFT_1089791 [Armillaria gallica]|uniref:Uncharacterized protein n=1 Tax=Armillaria gallica TaxID=47427 RepID=A0A2H3CV19_ARMGA|nr:hypothetical protein ARMGADRAFT_1089791 [Armillaria gallica]
MPTPSKTTTPVPSSTEAQVIESSMAKCVPPPQNVGSSMPCIDLLAASPKAPVPLTPDSGTSKGQVTQLPANNTTRVQQQTTQRKVKPMPITAATANVAFPPDPTSLLHQKPGTSFRFGPPAHTTGSEMSLKSSSSHLLMVDAATWPLVNPGPNPADEGTDDEEEQVQGDLVEDSHIEDEIAGTDGEDGDIQSQAEEDAQAVMALQVLLLPTWLNAFDMSPRFHSLVAPPSQSQDLRRSVCSNTSPVNHNAAYLKMAQSSKSDVKKKKKDSKSKDKALEVAVPHKRTRDDDDGSQAVDKPAVKKLKSKDIKTADDKVVCATLAVRKHGPGPTRPPAVTLGIGGGGFGEKVPSTAKAIKDGLKSIGVLEVEEDFGAFVKVDGRYWNKEVAPFVETLNVFEGALDTLAQHADSIEDIVINYMASTNTLTQLNGLRVQARRLHKCANFDDNAEDGGEGDEDEAPDDVAEGVSGPSKKKKGKSG